MNLDRSQHFPAKACASAAALLCGTAAAVALSSRQTERAHPPAGHVFDVSGVRVHYLEEGTGPPLVLVHGNAMSSDDFIASDVVAKLSKRYRVIVFDRPGFGYTERPRGIDWTPVRQAALLHEALSKLHVGQAIVVGHSLGALVSAALAIEHPEDVRALVLLSGYYYATMPAGLPLLMPTAIPIVGDVVRLTVAPIVARAMSRAIAKKMFAPSPVSSDFARYPHAMSRRPSQIRATTEDANFMDSSARELQSRYPELTIPVEILAGDGDQIVNTWAQSARLARDLPNAHFDTISGAGHMIHYIDPERVVAAIDAVERRSQATTGALVDPGERASEAVVA